MTQNGRGRQTAPAQARRRCAGITLTEVVISLAVTTLAVGGMVSGYTFSVERAEWAARSSAAQILVDQKLEQTKVARWDPMASPAIDELVSTNEVTTLAIPSTSAQGILATNITTVTLVSSDPPLKMIRIQSIWPFKRGLVTNTLVTYRSPDQ